MTFRYVPSVTVVTALPDRSDSGFPRRGRRESVVGEVERGTKKERGPGGPRSERQSEVAGTAGSPVQSSEFMMAVRRSTYQKRVVSELKSIRAAATCMFVGKVRITSEVS